MRVLIITGHFYMAEGTIAKGIVEALALYDYQIYFFSVHDFKYRHNEFVELTKKVDVIHWLFNVGNLSEKYKKIYKELKVPTVATVHHVDKDESYKIAAAQFSDLIHVVSCEWFLFLKSKTKTPVALASLGIANNEQGIILSRKPSKTFKVGMMGFYPGKNNRKRFDIAIAVFEMLISNSINVTLVIQGSGWEKFYDDFKRIGLSFHHFGYKSDKDIFDFFKGIDVYLCTSDIEGGPLPVLEAMSFGIPVVSTEVGISKDLLQKGGGFLSPKGDVKTLFNKLLILQNNNDIYQECSSQAKSIAENYYWCHLANQYLKLYSDTINFWEKSNGILWSKKNNRIVEANEQRKNEIAFSNLHQIRKLLENKQYTSGIGLLVKIMLDMKINLSRKTSLLKELIYNAINN